jgi:predicted naringenin-chalcone synthase
MTRFAAAAPELAVAAVEDLVARLGPGALAGLTHLVPVTCTGFAAPGIDLALMRRFDLPQDVERTQIGFMGCNAAFNGLKLARHVVRSDPRARVLVVNVELCTLHFQPPRGVDEALTFLLFADGAAASLVTAEPRGLALDRFAQTILPDTADEITWRVGDRGFDMHLSGDVPRHIARHLPAHVAALVGQTPLDDIPLWAVHPGGRSVLDAVQGALGLGEDAMAASRAVLRERGNMSSATTPFVLRRLMDAPGAGRRGVALGFGPGLGVESLAFAEAA